MKHFKTIITLPVFMIALMAMMSGCGSSGSGGGSTAASIDGIVCDAPIQGAVVTLRYLIDDSIITTVTTDAKGNFEISDIAANIDLQKCYISTKGGIDIETGLRFTSLSFKNPIESYQDYKALVVSPFTTLMEECRDGKTALDPVMLEDLAKKIGFNSSDDLKTRPDTNTDLQYKALVLITFTMNSDLSFTEVLDLLSNQLIPDVSVGVPMGMALTDGQRGEIEDYLFVLNANKGNTREELTKAVSKLRLEKIVTNYIKANDGTSGADFTVAPVKANLETIVLKLFNVAKTLQAEEFASSVEFSNGGISYDDLDVPVTEFATEKFLKKVIRLADAASGATGLDVGFFSNENPTTGNKRLFLYNSISGKISLAQDNVILGDDYFIYSGIIKKDDSVEYSAKEYGMFLDPDVTVEVRTAEDATGGSYEYSFYPDNEFNAFDASSPTNTWKLFSSAQFPASIHAQMDDGKAVLDPEYLIFNNITDYENSYVELIAADHMADANRGEVSGDIERVHMVVRPGGKYKTDAYSIPGKFIAMIKDSAGKTIQVLINYETASKDGGEPATGDNRKRLQVYSADLHTGTDVVGGDGDYFKWGENSSYIYLTKVGSETIYGFDKTELTLTPVADIEYPSAFTSFTNTQGGHNAGGRYNFYNMLMEKNCVVAEDGTTYLAINYDLGDADGDATYEVNGETVVLTEKYSNIFKHAMIYKVDGLTGIKIFDNGDGIDNNHAEASLEDSAGAVNLISASNEKLYLEIGSFDPTVDDVQIYVSSRSGSVLARYASQLEYGYITTDEMNSTATELSNSLIKPDPLRYMMYRVAPVTAGNEDEGYKLFITEYIETPYGESAKDNNIYTFGFETATASTTTKGTLSISLKAEKSNGCNRGSLILWSGEENTIENFTDGIFVSDDVDGILTDEGVAGPVVSGSGEWIGNTPLCGIGNLVLLRLDGPETAMGSSILAAGRVDTENSMVFVYPESPAFWDFK